MKAVLFDLDETLILDEPVAQQAFEAAARLASDQYPLDRAQLIQTAQHTARQLWRQGPAIAYCDSIGHSAFEGLWASYDPINSDLATLAGWIEGYRLQVWQAALLEQGIANDALAYHLVRTWIEVRQSYPWYPEVEQLLAALRPRYQLGIVTNGVPNLQRMKLRGASLETGFSAIAVSGEVGIGKPQRGIFDWICAQMAVRPQDCVMVGDNPERDVAGAIQAGMASVFVERGHKPADPRYPATLNVSNLLEMLPWLEQQG